MNFQTWKHPVVDIVYLNLIFHVALSNIKVLCRKVIEWLYIRQGKVHLCIELWLCITDTLPTLVVFFLTIRVRISKTNSYLWNWVTVNVSLFWLDLRFKASWTVPLAIVICTIKNIVFLDIETPCPIVCKCTIGGDFGWKNAESLCLILWISQKWD